MKIRRLKFQDLMIIAPDVSPEVTEWLQTSGTQIATLCLERKRSLRLVTHAGISPVTPLNDSHLRLFTHAFGAMPETSDARESDIAREFLDGNRSFRSELSALDQLLAELCKPLLILQNVSHSYLAAIADWLRTSPTPRTVPVVLMVHLPPASNELARNGSIQMVRQSLRSISEIINVTIFVALPNEEEKAADAGLLHDATIYCISSADLIHAAETGELALQRFAREDLALD